MLRAEKDTIIKSLRQGFEKSAGVLFLDYTQLTVAEANSFRRKLQKHGGITYLVSKNTLIERALKDTPYEKAAECLKGTPTGVVIGHEDPVASARIVYEFLKDCEHLKVKGGVLEARPLSAKDAEALSKMPSKGEVQAGIVTLALSPGRKLLGQVKSPGAKIAGAIQALVKRLEGAS